MEILRSPNSKRAGGAALLGLALLLGAAGCGESAAEVPQTSVGGATILEVPQTALVAPGQTVILKPAADAATRDRLVHDIALTNHIYPHGMADKDAPTVGAMPVRLNAQVTLHGRNPHLDDDLACDVVNLDLSSFPVQTQVRIGALALSKNANSEAMVAWPAAPGGAPSDEAFLCFPVNDAPSDDGVVLALTSAAQ